MPLVPPYMRSNLPQGQTQPMATPGPALGGGMMQGMAGPRTGQTGSLGNGLPTPAVASPGIDSFTQRMGQPSGGIGGFTQQMAAPANPGIGGFSQPMNGGMPDMMQTSQPAADLSAPAPTSQNYGPNVEPSNPTFYGR